MSSATHTPMIVPRPQPLPQRHRRRKTAGSAARVAAGLAVDSLGYRWLDGMVDAVAEGGPFCSACFSGEYSAPLVDLEG